MRQLKVLVFLNFTGILILLQWKFIKGMNSFHCSTVYCINALKLFISRAKQLVGKIRNDNSVSLKYFYSK